MHDPCTDWEEFMTDYIVLVVIAVIIYLSYRKNKEKIAGADVLGKPVPGIPKPTVPGVPRVSEVHTAGKTDQKAPQYIVHTELENGYMNLNGVRVKIKDADKLEW